MGGTDLVDLDQIITTLPTETPLKIWNLNIYQIVPYTTEERLPENFQYTDIFNDTVIISFPEDKLQEVTSQTWQHIDEPVYCDDDKEFISNKS